MKPDLPSNRAFLVWLSNKAEPSSDQLCGRVEHVSTGKRARFSSQDELNEFVFWVLCEEDPQTDEEQPVA
jgi:hypothetical protein